MQKETARSVIEVGGSIAEFIYRKKDHIRGGEIERAIWCLLKMVVVAE